MEEIKEQTQSPATTAKKKPTSRLFKEFGGAFKNKKINGKGIVGGDLDITKPNTKPGQTQDDFYNKQEEKVYSKEIPSAITDSKAYSNGLNIFKGQDPDKAVHIFNTIDELEQNPLLYDAIIDVAGDEIPLEEFIGIGKTPEDALTAVAEWTHNLSPKKIEEVKKAYDNAIRMKMFRMKQK